MAPAIIFVRIVFCAYDKVYHILRRIKRKYKKKKYTKEQYYEFKKKFMDEKKSEQQHKYKKIKELMDNAKGDDTERNKAWDIQTTLDEFSEQYNGTFMDDYFHRKEEEEQKMWFQISESSEHFLETESEQDEK